MKIKILTIFPDLVSSFMNNAIFKRALENNILEVEIYNLRDFSDNRHKSVDDYQFGGGPGMVLKAAPFINFFNQNRPKNVIFPSPQGIPLDNRLAKELSLKDEMTLICGHYEGIDERVIEKYVDLEISIGDYVVSGGELPALIILDAVTRFIPGFIKQSSVSQDSFERGRLDHAVYTRPESVEDVEAPRELLSGNHSLIEAYRERDSLYRTLLRRPDLLSPEDKKRLRRMLKDLLNIE